MICQLVEPMEQMEMNAVGGGIFYSLYKYNTFLTNMILSQTSMRKW